MTRMKVSLLVFFLLISSPAYSLTMKEALDRAAEYFVKKAVKIGPRDELHIQEITNFHTDENDIEGKRIETELYFALERQAPDFKLFLGRGGGNPNRKIYLEGKYEKEGGITSVKLWVSKKKEVLAQVEVEYDSKTYKKTLVAVLDIEAKTLNREQRNVFSDVFRSYLNEIDEFEMASSADIDKMSPDDIQKQTGCTRDTCATIIGEQLGVDRVISSSLRKVDEDFYFVSAKMMDIADGSILVSKTVRHNGDLKTLEYALEELAYRTAGEDMKAERVKRRRSRLAAKPSKQPIKETEDEVSSSNVGWHIAALTIALASAWKANEDAKSYNELAATNVELEEQHNAAISSSDLSDIRSKLEANREKMTEHKTNVQIAYAVGALALVWETYLIVWGGDSDEVAEASNQDWRPKVAFSPVYDKRDFASRLSLVWRW
ncbi:MAG: hypothetical protein GY866_18785 [Proteobacteria bacterium]|nr:hypothetical protein [Pseudomonadota bacterium]